MIYSVAAHDYDETFEDINVNTKPCNHRCLNKDLCQHACCKFGVPVSKKRVNEGVTKKETMAGFDRYHQSLRERIGGIPETPVKRLKVSLIY